jgi:hypothetical protein
MSYSRYGNRPLFDIYDGKAAIYIVRAISEKSKLGRIEEWLSVRMVPGDKRPLGVAEPEICESGGKRVDALMKKKVGADHFWNHVASSSRMCGIHPYTVSKSGQVQFLLDEVHASTSICFALMHKQFGVDYPPSRFPYRYITAMIRNDFYKKGLSYHAHGRTVRPVFTPAYRFLGLRQHDIDVRRTAYSYEFPLYWFDIKKLLDLVNDLRKKAHKEPFERLTPKMFLNLPKKINQSVPIAGMRMRPQEMRNFIDQSVPDAPELKITKAESWYRGMNAVLKAANVIIIK